MRIYLASSYRTSKDTKLLKRVQDLLESEGHQVWSAWRDLGSTYDAAGCHSIRKIVETEKLHILASDLLVAILTRPTPGTIMEIMFAYDNSMPVLCYMPIQNKTLSRGVWLPYHVDAIVRDDSELLKQVRRLVGSGASRTT